MKDILMGGGLDLISSKALVPAGSLHDCFNYEVGQLPGYAVSGGFERFDGRISPSNTDIWDMEIANLGIKPAEDATRTLSVTQDTSQTGLAFRSDGTRMYLLGTGSNRVYEFYLSTPWDISTAAHRPTAIFTVTAQDSNPQAIAFSGPKNALGFTADQRMFIVGTANNAVYAYELYEAGNLVVGAVFLTSLSVAAQETSPTGIAFSPDGLKMFICGSQVGQVHRYDLATAWGLGTAAFVHSLDISDYASDLRGVQFTKDGHVFYVAGAEDVLCFSCETAWDLTTAEYFATYTRGGADNTDIYLTPDDGRLFILDPDDDLVHEYGWALSPNESMEWALDGVTGSLGVVASTETGFESTTVRFAYWDAGDHLPPGALVSGSNGASFTEGIESLYWNLSSFDLTGEDSGVQGVFFTPDGLTMFAAGADNQSVYKYDLATAWDLVSASYSGDSFVVAGPGAVQDVFFSPDGLKMLVLVLQNGVVEYDLAVAWDITTASLAGTGATDGFGMTFSPDGLHLYVTSTALASTDTPGGYLYEYTLSVAWSIATASLTHTTSLAALGNGAFEEAQVNSIAFEPDGLTMYLLMPALLEFHRYDLTTAWDASTIKLTSHYFNHDVSGATGIFVSGKHFYVHYWGEIYEYEFYHHAVFTKLIDVCPTIGEYEDALFDVAEVFRSVITQVPGSGPVLGMKWYKQCLHVVRDYYHFNFRFGAGLEPQIGQHVLIGDGDGEGLGGEGALFFSHEGIVREIVLEGHEWAEDEAFGTVLIEPVDNEFDWANRLGYGLKNNKLWMLGELYFTSGSTEPARGQSLFGDTSASEIKVWRVEVQSGAWADGDAVGVIYFIHQGGPITPGEVMDSSIPLVSDLMTAADPYPTLYSANEVEPAMIFHSPKAGGASMAGLYRSSREGWEKIDLGHEVRFSGGDNGGNAPEPVKFGADTSSAEVTASEWAVGTVVPITGFSPSSGGEAAAIAASGGAYLEGNLTDGNFARETVRPGLTVTEFPIQLPEGARVVGIEIEITAKNAAAPTIVAGLLNVQPFMYDSTKAEGGNLPGIIAKRQAVGELTNSFVAYAYGGANDLWGAVIDRDMVLSANFGVKCNIEWETTTAASDIQIDLVRMRAHYVEQGQLVYFYDTANSADYASARLIHLHRESGIWGTDAAGVMQVHGLTKPLLPSIGVEIRTAAGGAGTLIANLAGNERRLSLPGRKLLLEKNSKYEMIAENVYARDDLKAIYGANGAGPAFSYDGFYLRLIHSGLSTDLDKPRHVDLFQFRLWLGYGFGEGAISIAGEPLVFDGSLNAVATGFGRPIVGFSKLAGKTMGVFTDGSVYAVTVEGNNFDQQVLAPNAGAREYTQAMVGTQAMYADSRGVSTPATTQNYGDFQIGRQSLTVHPWLLPRVQKREQPDARGRTDAVAANICRGKNQYRLYFADGWRMTFTLRGPEQLPEITKQFLYMNGDEDQYVRVLVTESEIAEDGRERMFFGMDVNPDHDHGDALGYCYEEDRGQSYDGAAYKRWIELNPVAGKDIHRNNVWGLMHIYGMCHGHAPLKLTTALDFAHPADADDTAEDSRYSIALGAASNPATAELTPYFDKERTMRRGRHLAIRFQGESDRELPHVIQHIALDEEPVREER